MVFPVETLAFTRPTHCSWETFALSKAEDWADLIEGSREPEKVDKSWSWSWNDSLAGEPLVALHTDDLSVQSLASHLIPQHCQEWTLSVDSGVISDYCQMWPPKTTTNVLVRVSISLHFCLWVGLVLVLLSLVLLLPSCGQYSPISSSCTYRQFCSWIPKLLFSLRSWLSFLPQGQILLWMTNRVNAHSLPVYSIVPG